MKRSLVGVILTCSHLSTSAQLYLINVFIRIRQYLSRKWKEREQFWRRAWWVERRRAAALRDEISR